MGWVKAGGRCGANLLWPSFQMRSDSGACEACALRRGGQLLGWRRANLGV